MNADMDDHVVAGWLHPLGLRDVLAALSRAGFSGDRYRNHFNDLRELLPDEDAATLHFLRHGFAEGRVFPVALDLAGLQALHELSSRHGGYSRRLLAALVNAWVGDTIREWAGIALHWPTIEAFRRLGALPLLMLGDRSVRLYHAGVSFGGHWICPILMPAVDGGLAMLLQHPASVVEGLEAVRRGSAAQPRLPTLWSFATPDRMEPTTALAENYAQLLEGAVPATERVSHHVAGMLPPAGRGLDELAGLSRGLTDPLLERTMAVRRFNGVLHDRVLHAGFNIVDDFDCLLGTNGCIDPVYLATAPEPMSLDTNATRALLSTSLRSLVLPPKLPKEADRMTDRFAQLLVDIRRMQLAEGT